MDVNPQQDIQDVKDPLKIPLDFYFVLTIVLIVIALLIAIYFAYRYYKKKHQADEPEKIVINAQYTRIMKGNAVEHIMIIFEDKTKITQIENRLIE